MIISQMGIACRTASGRLSVVRGGSFGVWLLTSADRSMKAILLPVVLLCSILASCTVMPTVARKADGSYVATTGGSILGRNKGVVSKITLPDGTMIEHHVTDSDNTAVASNYITGQVLKPLVSATGTALVKRTVDPQAIPGAAKGEALIKGTVDPQAVPGAAKGAALLQGTTAPTGN